MLVNPMPNMTSQVGKIGIFLGFIDLNCGWYCLRALIQYWYEVLNPGQLFHHSGVRKKTAFGFDPKHDIRDDLKQYICRTAKPTTLAQWENYLQTFGPIIVSGKLGAADWGTSPITGSKMGVGHYILIVGADQVAGTLSYKDPLQGNTLRTDSFSHMDKRITHEVDFITRADAAYLLNGLGTN